MPATSVNVAAIGREREETPQHPMPSLRRRILAWAIVLWQRGAATTGDVVLVCTLGLSVLHATRDLAVALVDVTQHIARLSEALSTLLAPHQLSDHPDAV